MFAIGSYLPKRSARCFNRNLGNPTQRLTRKFTNSLHEHQAWTKSTIDPHHKWYNEISGPLVELLNIDRHPINSVEDILSYKVTPFHHNALSLPIKDIREQLEHGRGFCITKLPPIPKNAQVLMYWVLGNILGRPFEQNVEGVLLYDVKDFGKDISKGARFSVTNYESSFHTDNAFGSQILDYVGLLCLNDAKSGGTSQVVSGYTVLEALQRRFPNELATLCQPFHVDRRGGAKPGEPVTGYYPVIARQPNGEILVRYFRSWIEAGHQRVNQPLTGRQIVALDALDQVASQKELIASFDLKPREIFWVNNRILFHNRTEFQDHEEPQKKRHLVRQWVQKV